MASALSAFVKGDNEIKEKLVSMDTTLQKIYSAQIKGLKEEEKYRRRQEQADKRRGADKKSPMSAFKKDKDDKKEKGFLSKLFEGLMKNPGIVKFLAALAGITVGAIALKKAFDDLKEGTTIWLREFKKQTAEALGNLKIKLGDWFSGFKKNADDFFKKFQDLKSWKGFKKGLAEAGESLAKKFPKMSGVLDDIGKKFKGFGKGLTKKGGLLDILSDVKIGKGLKGLGKRLPLIGELLFAGVTAKGRIEEGQGAGQVALGTGAEVAGGLAGAAAGGAAGTKLGAIIGSFIAPGIGTAIGSAIGGLSGAVLGGFGGAELLGGLTDKLYPQISEWVQNTIVAPFGNLMSTIGDFWTTNVVEPFLANPIVKWLTPIVEAVAGLTKSFVNFQMELAGAIGRITEKIFGAIDNEVKYWSGVVTESITGWWTKDVEPWWTGITGEFTKKWTSFLKTIEPVIKVFKAIKGVADQLIGIAQDKLIGAFESLAEFIQDKIVGFFKGPKHWLDKGADWIKNFGKQQGGVVYGYQSGGFVGTVPNQGGDGDRFGTMVQAGSVVMNQNAAGYQSGGMVPVMLEQGEIVVPPGPDAGAALMMNTMFPRFQEGGEVKKHPHLEKMSDENIVKASAPVGLCVTGSLNTMQNSGVPNPAATGNDKGNNPRGGAVQLINDFGWGAVSGGSSITLNSPYGTAPSSVMSPTEYSSKVTAGDIPSGAVVFQTRHDDWNGTSPSSRGYDMAIAQQGGRTHWNGQPHGQNIYGDTKGIMALTPGGKAGGGTKGPAGETTAPTTLGNIGGGLLNLGGDVGEFFTEIIKGLGDILGDIGGSVLGGLANYGNDSIAPAAAVKPGAGGNGATSVNDPNAKALLNAIADAEGTSHMPNQGYNTHFGNEQTKDLSQHPRKIVNKGGYSSDAFGRYQFLSTTWDGAMGGSMEPGRQDQGALKLVSGRGVNISDGLSEKEIYRLGGEWASIEGGPSMTKGGSYGSQAKYSAPQFMKMYENYGGKIQGKQSGGAVTAQPTSRNMVSKSQEQFIDKLSSSMQPVIVPVGMGGGGGGSDGGGMTGTGGSQTNVPNLSSHPSGNIALDNAFRLSLGAAFG